jgi:hypothetical protein
MVLFRFVLMGPRQTDSRGKWGMGQSVLIKMAGIQFLTLCALHLALCDSLRRVGWAPIRAGWEMNRVGNFK